jgi:hypothetical protein
LNRSVRNTRHSENGLDLDALQGIAPEIGVRGDHGHVSSNQTYGQPRQNHPFYAKFVSAHSARLPPARLRYIYPMRNTSVDSNSVTEAVAALQAFCGPDLTETIKGIELSLRNVTADSCEAALSACGRRTEVLSAAGLIKRLAGQIHVVVHALGILLCLPRILEPGEVVEYVSLGAGNTGRPFDLETNQRIAEFKFIHWQGGAEVIRQNALFKDFYGMAEHATTKNKILYVLGTEHPL